MGASFVDDPIRGIRARAKKTSFLPAYEILLSTKKTIISGLYPKSKQGEFLVKKDSDQTRELRPFRHTVTDQRWVNSNGSHNGNSPGVFPQEKIPTWNRKTRVLVVTI